ncbi:hypothetical protein [Kitasatospora sp. NPDC001225]
MQCTKLVCLLVTGGPDGYATHAYKRSSAAGASTFEGFFAFSGPGLHADTETKRWYDFENTSTFGGRGAGLVCVQMMYKQPDGSFSYGSQRCDRVYRASGPRCSPGVPQGGAGRARSGTVGVET